MLSATRRAIVVSLLALAAFALHDAAYAERGDAPGWRKPKAVEVPALRDDLLAQREPRREQLRELRQRRREELRERTREADEDQDRALNRAETERHFPRLNRRFDDIDTNRDGVITRDEVRAFRDARARARVWDGAGGDPRD